VSGAGALRLAAPVGLILVLGLASGLVPVINAEALLVAAVLQARGGWPAVVVAIAVGQSAAKVLIFLAARDGRRLLPSRLVHRPSRPARSDRGGPVTRLRDATRRWSPQAARIAELVRRPVAGAALILTSAVVGIPPLAATSVIAGAAHMRLALFGACCLTGRLVRFAIIAIPVAGWSPLGS
jgi:membrane protein YqaA with SNARE-associated domain